MRIFLFSLLFLSTVALADPIIKQGQIGLAPNSANSPLTPGSELILDVFVNERLGDTNTAWHLDTQNTAQWVPYGDVSIDRQSLAPVAGADNTTKIELRGMLIGSGDVSVQKLRLLDNENKYAIEVSGAVAAKVTSLLSDEDKKQAHWLLNPFAIGGWDQFKIIALVILALVITLGIVWLAIRIFRGRKKEKTLNPKEKALAEIGRLQSFVRGGTAKNREEWKKFSYGLAHTLRQFCEDLYHVPTHDLTDRELLAELRPHTDQKRFLDSLAAILNAMDSARYGQQDGDLSGATKLLVDAKNFVEQLYDHETAKIKAISEKKK